MLCITHLPQIAAHGATHFQISKSVRQGRTLTSVTRLDATEREEELARMIGGNVVTPAVRASAAEMLKARQAEAKGEYKSKGESESPARAKAKVTTCPGSTSSKRTAAR